MAGWLLHGILTGLDLCAVALGFYLFMRICRVMNFSYGGVIVLAPYVFGALCDAMHPLIAGAIAVCSSSVLALVLEATAFRGLRRRNAHPVVSLVASLGLFVVIQALVQIAWGPERRALGTPTPAGFTIGDLHLSFADLTAKGFCLLAMFGMHYFLVHTRLGAMVRALSCDSDLAQSVGIPSDSLLLLCSGTAASLGALGAISISFQFGYDPHMGQDLLFLVFPAVILGRRTFIGVACFCIGIQILRTAGLRFMPRHAVELILFSLVLVALLVSARFLRRKCTP